MSIESPASVLYDENGDPLGVTLDGRLKVEDAVPSAPPGTTAVNQAASGNVGGDASVDTLWVIPNTETLTLQRFSGGSEFDKEDMQSKCSLFYDPLGTGAGMTLIRVAYLPGNFDFALNQMFTGDGTRQIRMRRTRMAGGTLEIASFWDGYY